MRETERAKYLIKTPSQRARGSLDVQAKARVAHQMSNGQRRLMMG